MSVIIQKRPPYEKNGKWFTFFVEAAEGTPSVTTSDIEGVTITSTNLKIPDGYNVIDYAFDFNADTSSALSAQKKITFNADGSISLTIPSATGWTDGYIYAFAYKK